MKKFFTVCLCVLGFLGFSSVYAATQLNSSNCGLQELPLQTPSIKKSACNTKFALAPRSLSEILCVRHTIPPKEIHAPHHKQVRDQRQTRPA